MEKNRGVKVMAVVALLVAVVGLSIAYAAMSTTLKITGNATMETAKWDIKFEELSTDKTGAGSFTVAPEITGNTTIGDYKAVLTKPGDSVTLNFKITNGGTIDATLGTLTKAATPTCTGTGSAAEADGTLVCNNLTYAFTYADDSAIAVGDTLPAGESKDVKLVLAYNGTSLPTANVEITNLGITLVYDQA